MFCNNLCSICQNPCFKGEIKNESSLPEEDKVSEEKGLEVAKYEVVKSVFGKEKVRRIK